MAGVDNRPILVTGMHRSGTSSVARLLNLLGVDLGPPSDLMEAKPDNPHGFWERKDVVQLNDDLLARLGGRWDDPPASGSIDGLDDLSDFLDRGRSIAKCITGPRPGIKDPRASLLLGFWLKVWPTARVVVCLRDPVAVARSLEKRNGFDSSKTSELWLRYTLDAVSMGPKPILVRFEDMLADPMQTAQQLSAELHLETSPSDVAAAAASVVPERPHTPRLDEGQPSDGLTTAAAVLEYLEGGDLKLVDILAAGARQAMTERILLELRAGVSELERVADGFRNDLAKTQGDFSDSQFRIAELEAVAQQRLQALEREERAREKVAARLVELPAIVNELEWRRSLQYRVEKVIGRALARKLSGHQGES